MSKVINLNKYYRQSMIEINFDNIYYKYRILCIINIEQLYLIDICIFKYKIILISQLNKLYFKCLKLNIIILNRYNKMKSRSKMSGGLINQQSRKGGFPNNSRLGGAVKGGQLKKK